MGLGLLFGALIAGAALCSGGDSSSSYSDSSSDNYQQSSCSRVEYRYTDVNREKVKFFDGYRYLDNYLARLVGEGSGGIGLLIKAYKRHAFTDEYLEPLMSDLIYARDYRNNIAHNRQSWAYINDPDFDYTYLFNRVKACVSEYESFYSRILYNQKSQKRYY